MQTGTETRETERERERDEQKPARVPAGKRSMEHGCNQCFNTDIYSNIYLDIIRTNLGKFSYILVHLCYLQPYLAI